MSKTDVRKCCYDNLVKHWLSLPKWLVYVFCGCLLHGLVISRNKRAKEFWQKAMRCKCIYQVAAPHGPVDRHLVCNFDSNLSTVLYKSFTYLLKRQMWQNLGIFVLPTPNYRDCRPHPTRCIIGWFEAVYQVYCSHFAMVDLHDQPTKPMTATSCIAVLYLYNRLVMCN